MKKIKITPATVFTDVMYGFNYFGKRIVVQYTFVSNGVYYAEIRDGQGRRVTVNGITHHSRKGAKDLIERNF